jgi:tRNA(Ile)-lysidine synthase
LRDEAATEARQVGAWLAARGIAHKILTWSGSKPGTGIQAAARKARYGLLVEAAGDCGVLHLAVAHHADDQAETVLFRQERGSGPDGLAGMPACRSLGEVRLIRPLLGWPKAALVAVCVANKQPFVEDPSNRSPDYARPVLRQRLAADPSLRRSMLNTALKAAETRTRSVSSVASFLGRAASIGPDGIGTIDRSALAAAAPELRRAALSAMFRTVGGGAFSASDAALDRLDTGLQAANFRGMSLAGCLVRPWRGGLVVCREAARAPPAVALEPGCWTRWDDRFEIRAHGSGLTVGALGSTRLQHQGKSTVSAAARAGLPAVRCGNSVVAVPSLGWRSADSPIVEQRLSPLWPLASETFTVVSAGSVIMSDRYKWSRRH